MNNSRRVALKTTGAFATLVSLGIVTQSQAHAAMDRAGFDIKSMADAVKALAGQVEGRGQPAEVAGGHPVEGRAELAGHGDFALLDHVGLVLGGKLGGGGAGGVGRGYQHP